MMPIPSRVYNAAVGGHVAGADQIIDDKTGLTLDKVAGGALEEKEYISSSNNGMGRVVLRKNLVEGINTLTQSMINKNNTIYIIQYDFTLGEDIIIPANCVLEFNGGSISGAYTLTGNNTCINAKNIGIFGSDILFDGVWNVVKVLANWFKASSDTLMFSRAIEFASVIFENITNNTDYVFSNITVTCLNSSYTINDTLFIPICISFDGNGSILNVGSGLDGGKYMFRCNEKNDGSQIAHFIPQNMTYIGNFEFFNTTYDTNIIHCADNRRVENILSWHANRILVYTTNYLDNRIIRNITNWGRLPGKTFDITSIDVARQTSDIYLFLGDNTILENLTDTNICAESCQIKISRIISPTIFIRGCSMTTLEHIHLEGGAIKIIESEVTISDSLIYVNSNSIKPIISSWYEYSFSNITLKNVVFCNLGAFEGSRELKSWSPISGDGIFTFENVRGAIDLFSYRLMIKQNGHFINPIKCVLGKGDIVQDFLSIPKNIKTPQFKSNMYHFQTSGTAAYARLLLLVDEKKGLYKSLPSVCEYNIDQGVASFSKFLLEDITYSPILSLVGCIIRIEIGENSGNYTKYFDFGITDYITPYYFFTKKDNNYYFYRSENKKMLFSDIDYSYNYTSIEEYTRNGKHIECVLTENTLPDVSLFNVGDKCTTKDGKIYQKIGSAWIDATGTPA